MKRRQFLTVGTAVMAAPALPSVTTHAAPPPGTLPSRADIITVVRRMVDSTKIDDWWWCDALHMAMPPFARIGRLRGDPAYWTKLYQLYNHTKRTRRLWIPASGL